MLKVLHVSYSDLGGGAAKSAYRIHRALLSESVESKMIVNEKLSSDWTIIPATGGAVKFYSFFRRAVAFFVKKISHTSNKVFRSPSMLPSQWVRFINESDFDIVHLHWIQAEMLSISDIRRIEKPIVWTLHDMWAFSGAEHYPQDSRWHEGYSRESRSSLDKGFDLDRWVWNRKRRNWVSPQQVVCPSNWLGSLVGKSALMGGWPVKVIPYALDTDVWKPISKATAREILQLDPDASFLLFGSAGGTADSRKGFDLLCDALARLKQRGGPGIEGIQVLVFGQEPDEETHDFGFPVQYLGRFQDEKSLSELYSAADVVIIPSRQDNLPNVGVEAMACGTPIVAFDVGGLGDIVTHKKTGYLARPFDSNDLAAGIWWVLARTPSEKVELSTTARTSAQAKFSAARIGKRYLDVYEHTLKRLSSGG